MFDLDDVTSWIEDKFSGLDGGSAGMSLIVTFIMVVSLLDDPFHTGMNTIPLFYRLAVIVLGAPIFYMITYKMTN